MKVAVCIKQVPDSEARLNVAADGRWIDDEEIALVINESDEYALEEGLTLAEATGGEVVVFTIGGERSREALRKALALGASRAVHLADEAFAGGDSIATARALSAAVLREEVDIVLTGSQSRDLGWAATGSAMAGFLGWPHAWLVMGVELEEGGGAIQVTREMEAGLNEVSRMSLPAVIEVQAGINRPRYASLKGIMQAKRKEIAEVSPSDLGLGPDAVGAAAARVEILSVAEPEAAAAEILEGDPAEVASRLVEKLRTEARVI